MPSSSQVLLSYRMSTRFKVCFVEAVMETTSTTPVSTPGSVESSPPSSEATKSEPDPPPNGYIKKIPYSHSAILSHHTHSQHDSSGASTPNSMKNNCSRSSIDASAMTFLKKSFSVNSALSKHVHKSDWSSFTSSLSLAYLTSTFHLFSPTEKLWVPEKR